MPGAPASRIIRLDVIDEVDDGGDLVERASSHAEILDLHHTLRPPRQIGCLDHRRLHQGTDNRILPRLHQRSDDSGAVAENTLNFFRDDLITPYIDRSAAPAKEIDAAVPMLDQILRIDEAVLVVERLAAEPYFLVCDHGFHQKRASGTDCEVHSARRFQKKGLRKTGQPIRDCEADPGFGRRIDVNETRLGPLRVKG